MGWFEACFAALPDPRTGNAVRHDLLEVLTIALTAAICGAESCVDFADFAADRERLFREFLKLENGLPSHDTFSRIFRLLDPSAFAECFGRFVERLGAAGQGVLAIDGKTLRRSFDRAAKASPLQVVSAFACERRLVLGQTAVAPGENEITAARTLLQNFDLTGMLVTADAIHCQTETARLVRQRGGHYLFALKANRPAMFAAVAEFFADPPPQIAGGRADHVTTDGDHGRIETRRHWAMRLAGCSPIAATRVNRRCPNWQRSAWSKPRSSVTAEPAGPGATTCLPPRSMPRRLPSPCAPIGASRTAYIGCSTPLSMKIAPETARITRRKTSPENLAILRKLALNVLRTARPTISIRRKRKRSGWSDEFARSVIGQMR